MHHRCVQHTPMGRLPSSLYVYLLTYKPRTRLPIDESRSPNPRDSCTFVTATLVGAYPDAQPLPPPTAPVPAVLRSTHRLHSFPWYNWRAKHWSEHVDLWGYAGNALELHHCMSPGSWMDYWMWFEAEGVGSWCNANIYVDRYSLSQGIFYYASVLLSFKVCVIWKFVHDDEALWTRGQDEMGLHHCGFGNTRSADLVIS